MANVVYPILILIVAVMSIYKGFRLGITRDLASLMGFAFGAVASRVLTPEYSSKFNWTSDFAQASEYNEFTANLVCGVVIYFFVFWLFYLLTPILRRALSVVYVGILNRLMGAFFALVKNLLWLSIFFNLILCFSNRGGLLNFERANDGNLVAAVMALTPDILGCYGADDFAHFHQLRHAKTISCNIRKDKYVIITEV